METLVLNSTIREINYRGAGALHTAIPALVWLSLINADSLEPQVGENHQTVFIVHMIRIFSSPMGVFRALSKIEM
jgi:hypothetical protein